ncbi:MAG: hypothetical protein FJ147_16280 [Deltaproteobacteria bacterium]|nr:hypothetical protein [Deltaproteobacteria bacterium]
MIRYQAVEKKKPHFNLQTVKRLVKSPNSRVITRQAFKDAAVLGLEESDIVECVALLTPQDFYKKVFFNSYFPSSPSAACAGYWPSTP